jgi:hypothetical protein
MQPGCKVIIYNLNKRLLQPYLHFRGKSCRGGLLLEQECRLNKKFDCNLCKENERGGLRGRTRNCPDKARILMSRSHLQWNESAYFPEMFLVFDIKLPYLLFQIFVPIRAD